MVDGGRKAGLGRVGDLSIQAKSFLEQQTCMCVSVCVCAFTHAHKCSREWTKLSDLNPELSMGIEFREQEAERDLDFLGF